MGEYECINDFVRKVRRKETTRRPRGRWEDIIKMERRETEWRAIDRIGLAE
jgi:hypothetical protein